MRAWRALTKMSSYTQRPIVAVIGTTGVGKSQLAVSLARSLGHNENETGLSRGIVLSADSMQLYKGLDVITNKVTKDEMGGVEHWGLDIVTPGQGGSWEVGTWCIEAGKKIESLSEDTLPIICGGTHYFIQHFLIPPGELSFERSERQNLLDVRWKPPCPRPEIPLDLDPKLERLLDTFWTSDPIWPELAEQAGPSSRPTVNEDLNRKSLHDLLNAVDPNEAGRWHWRDDRKVKRSLERWWERGGGELKVEPIGEKSGKGRRARFRTIIFWVYEPLQTLAPRLDKRVDKMIENGLLKEISEMREIALGIYKTPNAVDHKEGIFQSIGYKEFADLELPQQDPASDPRFPAMVALTKLRTHQYARQQLKWIKKQLLPAVREARSLGGQVEVFAVPGGKDGEAPAIEALHAFLKNDSLPDWRKTGHVDAQEILESVYTEKGEHKVPDTAERQILNIRKICEICSEPGKPFSVITTEWEAHTKSRPHERRRKRQDGTYEREIAEQMAMRDIKRAEREALRASKPVSSEVVSSSDA